ncbi:hypothetical protein ACP4OV_023539 [Aristida adscensionis]
MAPGGKRKVGTGRQKAAEAPPTEYERTRVLNVMRNNQVLQGLGIKTLVSLVNNASVRSKDAGPQQSESLYDPDIEGSEQEEVSKVSKDVSNISARGAGSSKRVMAHQGEHTRVTQQMTAASQLVAAQTQNMDTHDALVSPSSPSQHEDPVHVANEGAIATSTQEVQRGRYMGKELDKISRGLSTKIAIQISEGKRRPEAPMQAAKLASEGGIILRHHIPIFPHWKEYKKNGSEIANYIGKVAMRYRLKKKYFNGVPANQVRTTTPMRCMTDDDWKELVEMWSTPKHKYQERCIKSQANREKVKFQQRTGSRCYTAHAYVMKQEKYEDTEPTAIDQFKDTHCSKKIGFSESVKKAIADMEAIEAEPVKEGQQPKSSTDIVSQVLPQSSTFLQNVGLQSASSKSSGGAVSSQVKELQAQLETEKVEAVQLRQDMHAIKSQAQESEATMAKQSHEIETLKNTTQELSSLLRQLIGFNQGQLNNPAP